MSSRQNLHNMTLFLLPNLLGPHDDWKPFLPASVADVVAELDALIGESEKAARLYLKRFLPDAFRSLPIALLNEHTSPQDLRALANDVARGGKWGLISDAGLPCLADPGAALVLRVRERGASVRTFAGPSSLIFALQLSGLPGQRFAFHGYLPIRRRKEAIRVLDARARAERETQLFIEAPYRNVQLFKDLLFTLREDTYLACAVDLTLPSEWVRTRRIAQWRTSGLPRLDKRPALFLISS